LLRDPGRHHVAGGVTVLDVVPPGLSRRGAGAERADRLATMDGVPDLAGELRRRLLVRRDELDRMGVPPGGDPVAGRWLADPDHWAALGRRLAEEVAAHAAEHPLEPGAPVEALRRRLGLPDRALVEALVRPPLQVRAGRVSAGAPTVPAELVVSVEKAFAGLGPFAAPEVSRLTELGLGGRQLGAAVRAGLVVQLAGNVVLPVGAPQRAAAVLAGLPQPFTLSEARRALDTSRRVAVPLLELLDRTGATRRLPDDRRTVASGLDAAAPGR
jgi:selenocysteine-specific elongation factor